MSISSLSSIGDRTRATFADRDTMYTPTTRCLCSERDSSPAASSCTHACVAAYACVRACVRPRRSAWTCARALGRRLPVVTLSCPDSHADCLLHDCVGDDHADLDDRIYTTYRIPMAQKGDRAYIHETFPTRKCMCKLNLTNG